jgi:hypothetical protein
LWFEGGLGSSPLSVKLGPMGKNIGGSANVSWRFTDWDGQNLLHLAYFDKLLDFSKALVALVTADIECQVHGNTFFSVNVRLDTAAFAKPFYQYMILLDKARKVARHFGINPKWTVVAFDADAQETAHDLHAIFFEGGLVRKTPNVSISLKCRRKTFKFDVLARAKGSVPIAIASEYVYTLLGEEIEVGMLTHEYTTVKIDEKKSRKRRARKQRSNGDVELAVTGSKDTVRTIRPGDLSP